LAGVLVVVLALAGWMAGTAHGQVPNRTVPGERAEPARPIQRVAPFGSSIGVSIRDAEQADVA
jgi:hypothetical protein